MSGPIDVLAVMDGMIGNTRSIVGLSGEPRLRRLLMEAMEARAAVAELIEKAKLAERELRDMADAGFGNPEQANDLRAALARVQGGAA